MVDVDPDRAGVSMAQLLAAFDGLGAHVCVLDGDGKVRWVNEPWRRFAAANGLSPQLCGVGADYLGACRGAESTAEALTTDGLRQVIAGESPEFTGDYPCHSPTEPRWFQLVARSFRAEDGSRGTIVVHTDITARVLAEQERAAVARNLLQLQPMETFGGAARTLAHEFNNALTSLIGYLELARLATTPAAPVRELLDEMANAVDRTRALVTRLCDLNQVRASRPEPVPLRQLADEVATLVRASLPSTQKVVVTGDAALAVRADRAQLRQLLLNLCNHAADALAGRVGTMSIRVRRERPAHGNGILEPSAADFACIEVHDDGRILSRGELAKLFEPFHVPAHARWSWGLGLSVALAIARNHGGTVTVTSEADTGNSIRLFLPIQSSGLAAAEQHANA
ncbi:MAG: two-component system sensor histidine kinase NtrB [Planctomycetota bacterium]|jgi:signal transduction histidine kinase